MMNSAVAMVPWRGYSQQDTSYHIKSRLAERISQASLQIPGKNQLRDRYRTYHAERFMGNTVELEGSRRRGGDIMLHGLISIDENVYP